MELYKNTTAFENWILLGSDTQAYRAGLVIYQTVDLNAGDVAMVIGEGEGSIYKHPWGSGMYDFKIFVSNALIVYPPGVNLPGLMPLGDWLGGIVIAPGMGTDIHQATTYYYPSVRTAAFKATQSGLHNFAMYWWGGSNLAGTGNSAVVYPSTSKITVVV